MIDMGILAHVNLPPTDAKFEPDQAPSTPTLAPVETQIQVVGAIYRFAAETRIETEKRIYERS